MPSKSGKQHRAMEAAAHGRSTLGIPKSVGKEYVAADKAKKRRRAADDIETEKKRAARGLHHARQGMY
jgi:hypothetical protein